MSHVLFLLLSKKKWSCNYPDPHVSRPAPSCFIIRQHSDITLWCIVLHIWKIIREQVIRQQWWESWRCIDSHRSRKSEGEWQSRLACTGHFIGKVSSIELEIAGPCWPALAGPLTQLSLCPCSSPRLPLFPLLSATVSWPPHLPTMVLI